MVKFRALLHCGHAEIGITIEDAAVWGRDYIFCARHAVKPPPLPPLQLQLSNGIMYESRWDLPAAVAHIGSTC